MNNIQDLIAWIEDGAPLDPTEFEMSTGDRLRLVADFISAYPEKWNQGRFDMVSPTSGAYVHSPSEVTGDVDCGTSCCVAGWAVRFMPPGSLTSGNWEETGGRALGLRPRLAESVFSANARLTPSILRGLADLPGKRTYKKAVDAGLIPKHWDT